MFHDRDLDSVLTIVKHAASLEIRPRFRRLIEGEVEEKKSSIDLVTQADLLSEKHMTEALQARWPHALVVGEEAAETDRSLIDKLKQADLAFVIDPVDGTFNFQAGLPIYGTNMAVVVKGETVAGIIHDSVLGDTLVASKGSGARFLREDGTVNPIAVAAPADLSMMVGTISINDLAYEERRRVAGNLAKTKMAFAYNCSAYEYWLVATGKVHFIGHYKLYPWDHLAGVLIHQEAGGFTARFDGSPYKPGDLTGGILSAPDRDSWEQVLREIVHA
ncbi:inositol monophosphatase family protein [Allorhizobium taibaishanense]|uniref:Inositol monophosphatase n=1 Tax=Allorhizobium taibaishanense TaxID=887144 RepID=A0A1Q9A0S7_9HYPH|nr:inositol monophosphatase family protein [Allorhizobium taibaishanense]MBB4007773.1 fructose-1,6-bisphosphatase/inositol monophosphatase family enzyme [Allorhizobium taibaishanense]OLP48119.1 inositol monophosphatase [Allorhizobium taibaishanense]